MGEMKKKALLFVGGLFPEEDMDAIKENSKGPIQYAANGFQWKLVRGFDESFDGEMTVYTAPFVGGFPRHYNKIRIKGGAFAHKPGAEDKKLPFFNVMGINTVSLYFSNKKYISKWISENKGKQCYIFFYSLQIHYLLLASYLKKHFPDVHLHVIVPDLPQYMELGKAKWSIYTLIKKIHINISDRNIKKFDTYSVLTESMPELMGVSKENCVLIEAIAENCDRKTSIVSQGDIKSVVYTGTLTKKYGIMDLVEAFMQIKKQNYRLIICGDGEARKEIQKCCELDRRIIYKGMVDSREIGEIQRAAIVLVNPRRDTEEYTKYSFPSKIMEYLMQGRPVLCFKLGGIPSEYDEYLNYVRDDSIEALTEGLKELCEKDIRVLEEMGKRGQEFVLNHKNAKAQTEKIVKLMFQK